MNRITAFKLPCNEQLGCTLFDNFPGEIRDRIFTFALSCYDDQARKWDRNSSFVRPDYSAPEVADTALLQTCQRIYAENWFRPWISAIHTFYLAAQGRKPDDKHVMSVAKLQPALNQLNAAHGEVEISHVRVFPQLYALEPGKEIGNILNMDNFFPRKLTITIRHHDWWFWEQDERLLIRSWWVNVCRFPSSLSEICMELESLQRKENQIDWIAEEMTKAWHFERKDGTILSANGGDFKVDLWSGSSTWERTRWLRDETQPGTNDYYVKTVIWKRNSAISERPWAYDLHVPHTFPVIRRATPSLSVSLIEEAQVPAGSSAQETLRLVQQWREDHREVYGGIYDDDITEDDDDGNDENDEDGDDDDRSDWIDANGPSDEEGNEHLFT
ncbi:hypothetical protein EDD36DRAFT_431063 [Exophiala viscosa]|uniref:F-box domain-containing protein n=1 Tax=Exophiala viscosa TaxID=2486360 RepID=A0AAN6E591_9EURO|nr:hypothetical protein EDD36DRAFT_431063 [Exophiala viscosa]